MESVEGSGSKAVAFYFRVFGPRRRRLLREDVDFVAGVEEPGDLVEDEALTDYRESVGEDCDSHEVGASWRIGCTLRFPTPPAIHGAVRFIPGERAGCVVLR